MSHHFFGSDVSAGGASASLIGPPRSERGLRAERSEEEWGPGKRATRPRTVWKTGA